ncbi:hypothetical protein MW887_008121 [Aspergillus wentii]|nr:hypothetical protein MW887_008121 [Aspergillus wentii]
MERLEYYKKGGYHPVNIGDKFQGRYRVVDKLGHGSFSTTWLARDEQFDRLVAVKVTTADSNSKEVDILSALTADRSTKGPASMIPSVLDRFNIQGPNGNHACHVTIPGRTSLSRAKDGSWKYLFQIDVARALAAQLTMAVEYVHSQGFVHGDLHLGNILLQVPPDFDKISDERLHNEYGKPEQEAVVRLDGKPLPPNVPSHAITPIWLGKACEEITLPESRILLTDFGEAFSPSQQAKYQSNTPLVVRPPEARFEPSTPLSFSSDIWTLACSIWNIIAQRSLFEEWLMTEDDMTLEHVDALGLLPPFWWEKWDARREKFNEDGAPINRSYFLSWEDRFEGFVQKARQKQGMQAFDPKERDAISAMLRSMLSFRPEDRPTAKKVLQFEWMVKWALPEYEKIKILETRATH